MDRSYKIQKTALSESFSVSRSDMNIEQFNSSLIELQCPHSSVPASISVSFLMIGHPIPFLLPSYLSVADIDRYPPSSPWVHSPIPDSNSPLMCEWCSGAGKISSMWSCGNRSIVYIMALQSSYRACHLKADKISSMFICRPVGSWFPNAPCSIASDGSN